MDARKNLECVRERSQSHTKEKTVVLLLYKGRLISYCALVHQGYRRTYDLEPISMYPIDVGQAHELQHRLHDCCHGDSVKLGTGQNGERERKGV